MYHMTSPNYTWFTVRPKWNKLYLQWRAFIKAIRKNFLAVSLVKQNIVFPLQRVDSYNLRADENYRYYLICCLLIFGRGQYPFQNLINIINFPPQKKLTYKMWDNISQSLWTHSLTPAKTQNYQFLISLNIPIVWMNKLNPKGQIML